MMRISLPENYGIKRTAKGYTPSYAGEIELIIRDKHKRVIRTEHNIIKIFAKEILSHCIPHSKVWDRDANTGSGDWVDHGLNLDEFSLKYIVFGASFDEDGNPLDSTDTRYYIPDSITGSYAPISLGVGAEYNGGLVNPIPISEPTRPLKRIERIYYEPSYQPAGTPLLHEDIRAVNNTVVLETTLYADEYNGFGITGSDYFTITEVALVGAAEVGDVGACECDPRDIFLTGNSSNNPFAATASGTATISLDHSETDVDFLREGDQVKIIEPGSTASDNSILDQTNPYYLITNKVIGGRDIVLDRTPVASDGSIITGPVSVLRDGFRIFSHRILSTPVKKSSAFEVTCRWRLLMG